MHACKRGGHACHISDVKRPENNLVDLVFFLLMWVPGVELRLAALCSQCVYLTAPEDIFDIMILRLKTTTTTNLSYSESALLCGDKMVYAMLSY